jgi:indolepyruvate ferredoxin oxidoreductase
MNLDDKYLLEEGPIALSGVQALVRLPLDQHRSDRRAGLNTATLISGYRGSPLGRLRLRAHGRAQDSHGQPGHLPSRRQRGLWVPRRSSVPSSRT